MGSCKSEVETEQGKLLIFEESMSYDEARSLCEIHSAQMASEQKLKSSKVNKVMVRCEKFKTRYWLNTQGKELVKVHNRGWSKEDVFVSSGSARSLRVKGGAICLKDPEAMATEARSRGDKTPEVKVAIAAATELVATEEEKTTAGEVKEEATATTEATAVTEEQTISQAEEGEDVAAAEMATAIAAANNLSFTSVATAPEKLGYQSPVQATNKLQLGLIVSGASLLLVAIIYLILWVKKRSTNNSGSKVVWTFEQTYTTVSSSGENQGFGCSNSGADFPPETLNASDDSKPDEQKNNARLEVVVDGTSNLVRIVSRKWK